MLVFKRIMIMFTLPKARIFLISYMLFSVRVKIKLKKVAHVIGSVYKDMYMILSFVRRRRAKIFEKGVLIRITNAA